MVKKDSDSIWVRWEGAYAVEKEKGETKKE
jgi:hypothetical protein